MNIRIMYGEYSKKEDYDLFGYTYIPAEPEKNEDDKKPELTPFEKALQEVRSGNCRFKFVEKEK